MVCSGSTQWTENEPSIFCSAQQCYPIPTIKNLEDEDLFPKNVFETGIINKAKLPVNVGWSSVNTILEEEDSVCKANSYEYQVTGASGTYTKSVLSSVRICDTIQECKDVWEEAREREDVAAMNRAKAIADELRKKVTDPTGSITIHNDEPSSQYPTYNFLTGQYDYVLAHQQEVTQDVVRRAFEACVLSPGTSYQLKVRACSDERGTDCQKWDSTNLLSFSTSLSPELISPYDPDWEGPNSSTIDLSDETQIPIRFQWCDTMQQHASSFLLQTSASYSPDSPQATRKERSFGRESTGFVSIPGSLEELLLSVDIEYFWRLIPCFDGSCDSRKSSHIWSLTPTIDFSQPQLLTPNETTLNMTNSLEWARIPGAEYYLVHIKGPGLNTTRAVQALSFPLS
ncbi:MAG: hypothetical protein Q8P71_01120, partial [bacterium]|nr:hypothetical protein [bacterium]